MTIHINDTKNIKSRLWLDMSSACVFLNYMLKIEKNLRGKGSVKEADIYKKQREFFHSTISAAPYHSRYNALKTVMHLWNNKGIIDYEKKYKNLNNMAKMAEERILLSDEPKDLDCIIVFLPDEEVYKLFGGQW